MTAASRLSNRVPLVPQHEATPGQPKFQIRGAAPSRTGMRFDPRMPFQEWCDLGARLATHASASAWWLGDWLVFGRAKYDRRYKTAIAMTGLDYQTLRNYAVVARRFDNGRRRAGLSFQHHAAVCRFSDEEQEAWLNRAEAARWSRNELRRRVRLTATPEEMVGTVDRVLLRLSVEPEREQRWRWAATNRHERLEEWMIDTLDRAAGGVGLAAQSLTAANRPRTGVLSRAPNRRG